MLFLLEEQHFAIYLNGNYFFPTSSDTVSFLLPFLLRAVMILRPLAVDIRSRKPCLFFLFLFEGW